MYVRFAIKDLFSQRFICTILFLLFFITSAAVFAGSIFKQGTARGIEQTEKRLGADVIVVPSEYSSDVQNSLFEGEACTINLDSSWTDTIRSIEGVSAVSAQRYIATLNAECCSAGGIQMIAYDPETDFTVNTWLDEQGISAPETNEIIMGAEAGFGVGETVSFFNREFKVKGVLDETGMGYDSSAFVSFETARSIASTDGYSMVFPTENGVEQVSMILIETDESHSAADVGESIRKKYSDRGIQAYSITSLVSGLMDKLSGTEGLISLFNIILILTSGISVFAIVTLNLFQRRVVLGRLISIGITPKKIFRLLAWEYGIVLCSAFLSAVILTVLIMYPMESFLRSGVQFPYRQPEFGQLALLAIRTFLIDVVIMGIALIYISVRQLSKDGARIVKEDAN